MSFSGMIVVLSQNSYVDKLNTDNANNWPNTFEMLGQFFSIVFIFAIVVVMAYFCTKWIGKMGGKSFGNNNIKIIEVIGIGFQNNLQLVKVGERYFLLGVSRDRISNLTEIKKEDIVIKENRPVFKDTSFDKYLNGFLKGNKNPDSGDK